MRDAIGKTATLCAAAALAAVFAASCTGGGNGGSRVLIQDKGSDTLVNVAQAWAETYRRVNPNVAVAVSGGGSGTGFAALINGTVDIANASRKITDEERKEVVEKHGVEPVEHVVANDAVVFFVNKHNPIDGLEIQQLACIYAEDGSCAHWSSLTKEQVPDCVGQEIIRIGRQSNSGTYAFVREKVLGKGRDFRLGSRDMSGSKDVVDIVSKTPCAIGYSGLGYATDEVKPLCVSAGPGDPCIKPTVQTAASGVYPLSRPLFMYTLGEATGPVGDYISWIESKAGQKIVADNGYVPLIPVD
jgi:phosphate transport system substrate-binding protein